MVRKSPVNIAMLWTLCALTGAHEAVAAEATHSLIQIAAQGQASLDGIAATLSAREVSAQRLTCMFGEEPDRVTERRRTGKNSIPDAADTCVAVLVRTARDGHLLDLYRTLLTKLGGNVDTYDKLPLAIGNAVMNGDGKVALGNGKNTIVAPCRPRVCDTLLRPGAT